MAALVVERIEERLAAVQRDAPAGPRSHGFEPHHVGRVGERLANVADAVLVVDCRARAGERQDRKPAHLVVVAREHDRERLGVDALRRAERRQRVALLARPAALEGPRNDAQARHRVLVERRYLAPQPRHRLERSRGADVRFVRERGKRPLEDLAKKGFGGFERLDLLVRKATEGTSDGGERPRIRNGELQITGGQQGVEHGSLLLTVGHTVERRPAKRQAERRRRNTARRPRGEIWQEIGDDVAALEAADGLNRPPGERAAERREQDVEIGRGGGAVVLDRQDDRERDLARPGRRPPLLREHGSSARADDQRERERSPSPHPTYFLRPEYSSICVARSIGYEIFTSVTRPSAALVAVSRGCTNPV